ncbi:hypothetical protein [Singulisphaera acidiphila]|uniref:Uncharacterized protein n=1 Tax=Singulisphaera acidiphila (strain ATCC BAA-1392 / DSM 18658 / VKM B-2454 / MOB10) TaxID=886293 RepID=L0DHI8_SINAD|nr:hypothetical protein [Singulisphaera acidiphila]AGA28722.1 hypothetical protein Sinac_4541 [Singulisphaera acidiphila DSM 18658]
MTAQTEETPEDEQTAAGFMSLIAHDCDAPEAERDTIEFEDMVGGIRTIGRAAHVEDGELMGPTIELVFSGAETRRHVQVLLDARAALELVGRLAYAAGKAIEGSDHA